MTHFAVNVPMSRVGGEDAVQRQKADQNGE